MKEIWTTMASIMGVWAFGQSLLHAVFPPELRFASLKFFHRIFSYFSSYCYYDITEIDGVYTNELYNAVQLYLSSSASIAGTRLSLTRGVNSSSITFGGFKGHPNDNRERKMRGEKMSKIAKEVRREQERERAKQQNRKP